MRPACATRGHPTPRRPRPGQEAEPGRRSEDKAMPQPFRDAQEGKPRRSPPLHPRACFTHHLLGAGHYARASGGQSSHCPCPQEPSSSFFLRRVTGCVSHMQGTQANLNTRPSKASQCQWQQDPCSGGKSIKKHTSV